MILFLSFLTFQHTRTFADGLTFGENAARTSPSDKGNHNNATTLRWTSTLSRTFGDSLHAEKYAHLLSVRDRLATSLSETPDDADLHHSLGIVYYGLGFLKSAEKRLMQSIQLDGTNAKTYCNLGALLYRGGKEKDAETQWLLTLSADSTNADAMHNLCYLYYTWRDLEKARHFCRQALYSGAVVASGLLHDIGLSVGADK
jgi:tetratricopeptide (TPR) repeat protein